MENRSVTQQDIAAVPQASTDEFIYENSLSDQELQSLVQFFELLDQWDREVVQ
jgi:hypothetical protein